MKPQKEDPVDACIRVLGEEIRRLRGAVERTGEKVEREEHDAEHRTG